MPLTEAQKAYLDSLGPEERQQLLDSLPENKPPGVGAGMSQAISRSFGHPLAQATVGAAGLLAGPAAGAAGLLRGGAGLLPALGQTLGQTAMRGATGAGIGAALGSVPVPFLGPLGAKEGALIGGGLAVGKKPGGAGPLFKHRMKVSALERLFQKLGLSGSGAGAEVVEDASGAAQRAANFAREAKVAQDLARAGMSRTGVPAAGNLADEVAAAGRVRAATPAAPPAPPPATTTARVPVPQAPPVGPTMSAPAPGPAPVAPPPMSTTAGVPAPAVPPAGNVMSFPAPPGAAPVAPAGAAPAAAAAAPQGELLLKIQQMMSMPGGRQAVMEWMKTQPPQVADQINQLLLRGSTKMGTTFKPPI